MLSDLRLISSKVAFFMHKQNNIFLIGLMGTGKTTVGRQLSRKLKMEFYDSDRVIEERTGADIPLIFEKEGETGFRKRETAIIDELTQKKNIILATGGGAILDAENRKHMINRGTVFYLKSNLKTLISRTSKDKNRPLLHADEPPKVILQRLLEQRGRHVDQSWSGEFPVRL